MEVENRNNNNIGIGSSALPEEFKICPYMKIGYVSLNVSDVQRSIEFYQSVLGFSLIGKASKDRALLSSKGDESHLVELVSAKKDNNGDTRSEGGAALKRAGLYHFAILLPERKYLADMLVNLSQNKVHLEGLADHLVSEAIYIRDPDFNGVEIYCDRPNS